MQLSQNGGDVITPWDTSLTYVLHGFVSVVRFKMRLFVKNITYNHMNENNIRLETSTKEQKEPLS